MTVGDENSRVASKMNKYRKEQELQYLYRSVKKGARI